MTEETLFHEALAKPSAERAVFLEQACAGQPQLRAAVEALLSAREASGSFLKPLAPADLPATAAHTPELAETEAGEPVRTGAYLSRSDHDDAGEPPRARPTDQRSAAIGTVIAGRYTLVEVIGEGGMGSVYLAEQSEPVKRQVALKLIKSGMDSRTVLHRFEAERQALAMMDHPNIARIYDGGVTGFVVPPLGGASREEPHRLKAELRTGQPFFVMELVRGIPITRFCDERRLGIRARLELFVSVCQAVQHAHQKGIIHRDLKPGNVLVTEVDGRPTPKVIDFGVAKATEQKLTDASIADVGLIVGTPAYMSPEQADPSSMDIDTRTDVYALGVILYELLTGAPPFDARHFKRGAILEMLRMVREDEPQRPSAKLRTADALPSIAANRDIDPAKLAKFLQGELDWLVMKALEKDRTRRYETANGFARDIQRYLADEVVEARPPSTSYRLKKFVRRHKGQVIAAGLVLLALVAGMAGTTWQAILAEQARADAQEKEQVAVAAAEKERAARLEEERQRKFAEAINQFVKDDFLALTSVEGQDRFGGAGKEALSKDTTLRELLDRAAAKLRARKDLDPRIEAELCWIVGVNYRGAGEAMKGLGFLERAVQLRSDLLGRDHADTLDAMNSLGAAYFAAGKLDLALPLSEETLKLKKAKLGPEHPDTILSMNNVAVAYRDAGKLDLAMPLLKETLQLWKAKLGPEHPHTLVCINDLAMVYQDAGMLDLALPLFEETLKLRKAKLGPEHPHTLLSMNNLAGAYPAAGKLDLALPLFEETLKLRRAKLGPEHPDTLQSMNNLAAAYSMAKQLDKSIPLFEETLKRSETKLGRDHPGTLHTVANLGVNYKDAGRLKEAIALLEEAHRAAKKYPEFRAFGPQLLDAYAKAGENAKLANLLREQLLEARKALPKDSPQLAGQLAQIGLGLLQQKQWTEVEPLLRECLAIRAKKEPEDWRTFNTKSLLGGALLGQKKYADAEPLLLAGYEGMKQREKTIPPQGQVRIPEAIERLVQLYEAMDKKDDAAKWRKELEATKAAQKQTEKQP